MNTPSDRNPYKPPQADVTPRPQEFDAGEVIDGGQSVPAGNGISWIGEGFRLFGKSPGIWILNTLILFVLSIAIGIVPILGGFAMTILMPIMTAGLMLGCRALDSDYPLEVGHLFAGFKENAGQLALVGLLMLVAYFVLFIVLFIVGMVVFGASILQFIGDQQAMAAWFVERGLMLILLFALVAMAVSIPIMMASWFAPALVAFHNLDAMTAMRKSFQGCLRNILPFLLYGIVLFVLVIVAVIPLGLGLLVFVPMTYASLYASYKDIYLQS